jgi:WD40 repeat protein
MITSSPTITLTSSPALAYPLTPGPVITKDNASQVELLGSIQEKLLTSSLLQNHLAWSPDNKIIAVTTNGDGVQFIDPLNMKAVGSIMQNVQGLIDKPSGISYSPDGKTIAVAIPVGIDSYPGDIAFYDVITYKPVRKNLRELDVNNIKYSHNGRWLAVATTQDFLVDNIANNSWPIHFGYDGYNGNFTYANISPNDQYVAFGGLDSTELMYSTSTWSVVFQDKNGVGGGLCFSPDNKYYITGVGINKWSLGSFTLMKSFGSKENNIHLCDYGKMGDIVIWDTPDIDIVNEGTGEIINSLKIEDVSDMAFSPDGRFIAALGRDNNVYELCLWGIPA